MRWIWQDQLVCVWDGEPVQSQRERRAGRRNVGVSGGT